MMINLWVPGISLSKNSAGLHLLNAMCDFTKSIVSNITTETHGEHPAKLFMENVVLLFVMVEILVADDNSLFKRFFKDMCSSPRIIYLPLSRGNHKGMISLFKKRRQSQVKTEARMKSFYRMKKYQYAWNSAPIDGTDILRSVAAIGR